jgi:hypothetical protein
MMPNDPLSSDGFQTPTDDDQARFFDDAFDAAPDDLGDWWLDLGRVTLPV